MSEAASDRTEQTHDEVRSAMRRILASDPFRSAPQLSAFLNFVVSRTIEGRAAEIKGYTIATEALGRDASFDPQSDPIVRVEAMRLRRALDAYYQGAGAGDPVRIELPRGAYVPVFKSSSRQEAPAGLNPAWRRPAMRLGLAGAAAALLLTAGWTLREVTAPEPPAMAAPTPARLVRPALALIEVAAPVIVSIDETRISPGLLTDALIKTLARFDEIDVVDAGRDVAPTGDSLASRYMLHVNLVARGTAIRFNARLTHRLTGQIVWVTERDVPDEGSGMVEFSLARSVAAPVAQPYGVIFADLNARMASADPGRCLLRAFDHWRAPARGDAPGVRACLDDLIDQDLDSASLYAMRAMMELTGPVQGGEANERALSFALRAMEASPQSARARQALMEVYFATGHHERALDTGKAALARNPLDGSIMAHLATMMIRLNRLDEGRQLLEQAVALMPVRPDWVDAYRVIAAHMAGDVEAASSFAARLRADGGPMGHLAAAIEALARGDEDAARQAIVRLVTLAPDFAEDATLALQSRLFGEPIAARLVGDLMRAGLNEAPARDQDETTKVVPN